MFPGPWRTGSIATAPPTISTSWYNLQTAFIPPPTQTITANLTAASLIAARTSYCPITDEDYANGFEEADLPDACEALIEPYCWPNPDAPILTSTTFPAACKPNRSSATATSATTAVDSLTSVQSPTSVQSSTSVANPVPSPLEPNTTANCKQYYQVLNGDNCYSIANNSKITLDQVRCVILFKENITDVGVTVLCLDSIRWDRLRQIISRLLCLRGRLKSG